MTAQEEIGANVREIMGIVNDAPEPENTEESEEELKEEIRRRKRRTGRIYTGISYFFVLIFLMLIGYIVYFNLRLRDDVLRSPYNKRQDAAARYVQRGPVISADGVTLAYTETDDGEEYRVYPEGRRFAHIIGYDTHGKTGAESIANYELLSSDEPIITQFINDLRGRKNKGNSVYVTVDCDLQRTAYSALGDHNGAVCAMDPDTGAILAMVSKPDFDPNTIRDSWNEIISEEGSSVLVNRATQGRYPPGSTFKMVTALAYMRAHGGRTDGFTYECTGEVEVGGHTIHCAKGAVHGTQTFEEAFANSCNCAFAEMGSQLGSARLRDAAEDLCFNRSLPLAGLAGNMSSFSLESSAEDFLVMQTAFGQGKTLTSPWHMTLIVAAIARGGVMPVPYLIDRVENAEGVEISKTAAKDGKRIITAKEAAQLKSLLQSVVSQGTAASLADRGYSAYGKTGSAEYTRSDGETGTHSWFTGYAERDGKRIVVTVLAEDGGSGSSTALPAAREIFDAWFG